MTSYLYRHVFVRDVREKHSCSKRALHLQIAFFFNNVPRIFGPGHHWVARPRLKHIRLVPSVKVRNIGFVLLNDEGDRAGCLEKLIGILAKKFR